MCDAVETAKTQGRLNEVAVQMLLGRVFGTCKLMDCNRSMTVDGERNCLVLNW